MTKPPAVKITIEIGEADAGDPRIAATMRAMIGGLAPLVSAADLEELQSALEAALLSKRIAEPPRRRKRKEKIQ